MTILCLDDASVVIGGTDLSDHVISVELPVSVDEIDTTAMGTSGWRAKKGGLKDLTFTVEFHQDYAVGSVDATIWPLLGTSVAVVVKPTTDLVSVTNPSFSGNVVVNDYTPISGSPGSLATFSVSWPSNGVFTRAIS